MSAIRIMHRNRWKRSGTRDWRKWLVAVGLRQPYRYQLQPY